MRQKRSWRTMIAWGMVIASGVGMQGSVVWAQSLLDSAWGNFDQYMSSFDPLGKAIRDPLQDAIPGLRVVGFYRQWVDWNVDGNSRFFGPPGATGSRPLFYEKKQRYQQLTSMAELQLRYSVNPTLQLVSAIRGEYNGTYDVHRFVRRDATGHIRSTPDSNLHWLKDPDYIFREAYVDWFPNPAWRLVVGRQQEAWGKLISPITDVIHGFDQREGPQLEGEDFALRRLNRLMMNLSYYTEGLGGTNEFKVLWIPEWQGDRFGPLTFGAGGAWNPPNFPQGTLFGVNKRWHRRPHWGFADHEVFARWTWSGENLTFFLMYGYLWDRTPTVWTHRRSRVPAGGRCPQNVQTNTGPLCPFLAHARGHGYGGGLDYAYVFNKVPFGIETLPLTITLESFMQSDMEYGPDASLSGVAARVGGAVARGEIVDNHVRRTSMRHALQFDLAFPDRWNVNLINIFFYTFDWKRGIAGGFTGPNEWVFIPVFVLAHPWRFTEDRLNTTLQLFTQFAGPRQTDLWGGIKLRPIFAYSLSQYIELRFIGTLFFGHGDRSLRLTRSTAPTHTEVLGAYDTWTRYKTVGIELNYTF